MINFEKASVWVAVVAALGTAIAAYAKIKSDGAVALEKVQSVNETLIRIDQKIEVINKTAERVAKVEERTERIFSDLNKMGDSVVRISDKVEGINVTTEGLKVQQTKIIDSVNDVRRRMSR